MNKLKEIKELESKIATLREEIAEGNTKENIMEIKMTKTEVTETSQFVSKEKVKFKANSTKTNDYIITYRREGRKIICEFKACDFKGITGIGIANCKEGDKFDYSQGVVIAELRARSDFYQKVLERHIKYCL